MKIIELVDRIKKGETTARAQVERSLAKAQETEEYHALLSLTAERALQRADEIDEQIKKGENPGVLAGGCGLFGLATGPPRDGRPGAASPRCGRRPRG